MCSKRVNVASRYLVFSVVLVNMARATPYPFENMRLGGWSEKNDKTSTGFLGNTITQVQNMPGMEFGRRFRSPCKTGNHCGKVMRRLMVPKLAQLENTIMGVMKDLAKMAPGARLPDKMTKTEPIRLTLDGSYKEPVCRENLETCLREDKRRKRILKKLFFKKYNAQRLDLIGYGGRRLWGGEGNLFY